MSTLGVIRWKNSCSLPKDRKLIWLSFAIRVLTATANCQGSDCNPLSAVFTCSVKCSLLLYSAEHFAHLQRLCALLYCGKWERAASIQRLGSKKNTYKNNPRSSNNSLKLGFTVQSHVNPLALLFYCSQKLKAATVFSSYPLPGK